MSKVSKSRITNRVGNIDLKTGVVTESLYVTNRTRENLSKGSFTTVFVIMCVVFIILYAVLHSNLITYSYNDSGNLEKVGLNIAEDFSLSNYLTIFDDSTNLNNFFNEWTSLSFEIPELPENPSIWDAVGQGIVGLGNVLLVPIRLIGFIVQSVVNTFTLVGKLFTWG